MAIKTYKPKIEIRLKSGVSISLEGQTNFGKIRDLDITPFLGENGTVEIEKSVMTPFGQFKITIPDKPVADDYGTGDVNDTIYGLVESFDYIEIKMTHDTTQSPKMMMRGWITSVEREETISQDGQLQRVVTLAGNDLAYVFNIASIMPPSKELANIGSALSSWSLAEALGLTKIDGSVSNLSLATMYQKCLDIVINPRLAEMSTAYGHQIQFDNQIPSNIITMIDRMNPVENTIWQLWQLYSDSAWYELFTEDREDEHYLVVRPKPYMSLGGEPIEIDGTTTTADSLDIDVADIVELRPQRSEADVLNIFLVSPYLMSGMASDAVYYTLMTKYSVNDLKAPSYANSDSKIYGYRTIKRVFRHLKDTFVSPGAQQPEAIKKTNDTTAEEFTKARAKSLFEMTKDNVLFTNGTMRLRGNVDVKAGIYLNVRRGQHHYVVYVQHVRHVFAPFGAFVTDIQFIRGTDYYERKKMSQSPYLAEGRRGVYSK